MKKIKPFILITRPLNCGITFATIVIACAICKFPFDIPTIIIAGFIGALVNAGGNVINDYFDLEIDKLNRPNRILPANKISKSTALLFYLVLTLIAIGSSFFLTTNASLIVLFTIFILFFYSYKLKQIPLWGNIAVAFSTALAFLFGSVVVGNFYCGITPAIFAFLISLMRELVKDIEDIKGDSAIGISTFPIKYGVQKTISLISVVGIILIISTTIPILFKFYNVYYFIFVSLFVNSIIVNIIRKIKQNGDIPDMKKVSKELKIGMVLGIISIVIGIQF